MNLKWNPALDCYICIQLASLNLCDWASTLPRNWTEEKKKSRGQVEKEGRIGAVVVFFFFKAMRKQKLDQAYIQEIRQLHMYVCCIPSLMKEILTSTNLHCKNLSVLEKRMNFPHCVLQPAAGSFRWDG